MKLLVFGVSTITAASIDRCFNKPNGTQYADPNNPQGWIECQNGQSTYQDCDAGLWYIPLLRECLDEPPMCNAPPNFQERYDQVHGYHDGIYYMSSMKPDPAVKYLNFEALIFCSVMGSYVAMPYTQEEYDYMKLIQDKAIARFRTFPNGTHPEPETPYEFFMGIVGQNVGNGSKNPLTVEWYYYNLDRHYKPNNDDMRRGLKFNQTSWWDPGYPTTDVRGTGTKLEKRVIQTNPGGLENRPYSYEAPGVNCMYVCPQKNP